jgi:hypothetical protein
MARPRQIPMVQINVALLPHKVAKGEVHVALGKVCASVTYRAAQPVSYCSVCHARFPDGGDDMWLPVPLTAWEMLSKTILREVRN